MTEKLVYVRYRHLAGKQRGIAVSWSANLDTLKKLDRPQAKNSSDSPKAVSDPSTEEAENDNTASTTSEFEAVYKTLWDNLGRLIMAMPQAQNAMGMGAQLRNFHRVEEYLQAKGTRVGKKRSLYGCFAINEHDIRSLHDMLESHAAQATLINGLPRLLVPTVVAHYDAFVAKLILLCLRKRPEVAKTIQKDIKMSELVSFATIEEAAQSIIDREVESVMRGSHLDQLMWLSGKFKIKADPEAALKRNFVELTERRNIIIHNDGRVNAIYLRNCASAGVDVSGIEIGGELHCDGTYLQNALACALEMATKLHQVFWRQLAPKEIELADKHINHLTYQLLINKKYKTAEPLFQFCRSDIKKWSSEEFRLMNVVNHANTLRLLKKNKEAKALLGKEEWNTKTPNFQICVAAVEEDDTKAIELLRKYGKVMGITAADYMHWPVFLKLTKNDAFLKAYKDTFGEDLAQKPTSTQTTETSTPVNDLENTEAAAR